MPTNQIYQEESRTKCPYKVEGNINSSFVIKYIDSPYCVWCWIEEGVLKKAIAKNGNSFKLERYDIRYCDDIRNKYKFSGTSAFVFSLDNGKKGYTYAGFISEGRFNKIICEASGNC